MKIKFTGFYVFMLLMFLLLNFAFAQSSFFPLAGKSSCNPAEIRDSSGNIIVPAEECTWNTLTGTIRNIIKFIVTELAPALAMIFVLYGGFLIMLGGPSPSNIGKGKEVIYTALVGYILVLISGFILDVVLAFLSGGKDLHF
ncbi:MAG: hypothetical protein AAB371_02440 [Patescibacteria group bacterium]